MTTNPIPPISDPVQWDELIAWITNKLSSNTLNSAPIPESWQNLITWLINEIEASFGSPQPDSNNEKWDDSNNETWESDFRDAHRRARETLDTGAERVIDHIREMPSAVRAPATVWWKVAWEDITAFFTKLMDGICGFGQSMWESVKALFAKIRRAFARVWARCSSSGSGQIRLRC